MNYADKLKVPYVYFLGEDEINAGVVSCKDMRTGEQVKLPRAEAVEKAKAFVESDRQADHLRKVKKVGSPKGLLLFCAPSGERLLSAQSAEGKCGVRAAAPRGDILFREREYPPLSRPHTVWGTTMQRCRAAIKTPLRRRREKRQPFGCRFFQSTVRMKDVDPFWNLTSSFTRSARI